MVWTVSTLIIIFLAVLTWKTTHVPEPSKPPVHDERPTTTEVVSVDWKWFFIHSGQGIVTVNEIAFPMNTPVYFEVTSSSVMNSFFIPHLGNQIYAMADMQTRLHLVANESGTHGGISVSYNGPGLSGMKFKAIVTPDRAAFDRWVVKAKQSPNSMPDMAAFEKLVAPNEYNQVGYFSDVKPDLFVDITNRFMAHGKNMDMTQSEGEHSAYEGMKGMDTSHVESIH